MSINCPKYGDENANFTLHDAETGLNWYECPDCDYEWSENLEAISRSESNRIPNLI